MALSPPPVTFMEALTEHLGAIGERDIDRFGQTLSPEIRMVGRDGRWLEGRDNAVAAHRDWFAAENWRMEPEILWTREEPGAAWALCRVTYEEGGQSSIFMMLLLFAQEDGVWKLAYDQSTTVTATSY